MKRTRVVEITTESGKKRWAPQKRNWLFMWKYFYWVKDDEFEPEMFLRSFETKEEALEFLEQL